MALRLQADETKPVPRPITLTLRCDGMIAFLGSSDRCSESFVHTGDYALGRTAATALGWLEKDDGRQLCPHCAKGRGA